MANQEKNKQLTGKKGIFRRLRDGVRSRIDRNFPAMVVAFLLFLFMIGYLWPNIIITVHAGELGVLYRRFYGGTVVDKVYGEGIHIIWPWNIMTVYDVRYQTIPHSMDVLTQKGLTITVNLSIRYRPETDVLGVLHKVVGPDYLKKIVLPEVEATLRSIMGQYDAAEIYTAKKGVVQQVLNESLAQVAQRFVKIDNVMITRLDLPPKIKAAIEQKMEGQQMAQAYEFKIELERKEALRKQLEATGIRDYNTIVESSLSEKILNWKGLEATRDLSMSPNTKVVIIGRGKDGLPIILDTKNE